MAFKKYRSHKVVNAAKIVDWSLLQRVDRIDRKDVGGVLLGIQDILMTDEDGDQHQGDANLFARGQPEGDYFYLVEYEDGHLSWSPKDPFEGGYDELEVTVTIHRGASFVQQFSCEAHHSEQGEAIVSTIAPTIKQRSKL